MLWFVYKLCIRCRVYNLIHNSSSELQRGHIPSLWLRLTTRELRNKTMNSSAHQSTEGSLSWLLAGQAKSPYPAQTWLPSLDWLLRQWILARPRQPQSWWGWCSSSPAARWWISSILEADMAVKGHYKVGPHKNTGLVGSNKRWADSEMVVRCHNNREKYRHRFIFSQTSTSHEDRGSEAWSEVWELRTDLWAEKNR